LAQASPSWIELFRWTRLYSANASKVGVASIRRGCTNECDIAVSEKSFNS